MGRKASPWDPMKPVGKDRATIGGCRTFEGMLRGDDWVFPNDLSCPAFLLVYVHRAGQTRGFFALMHLSAAGFALRLLTWPILLSEGNPRPYSEEASPSECVWPYRFGPKTSPCNQQSPHCDLSVKSTSLDRTSAVCEGAPGWRHMDRRYPRLPGGRKSWIRVLGCETNRRCSESSLEFEVHRWDS